MLVGLVDASMAAVDEEARRRAPLVEGERVDVNRADEIDLDRLPGVGPSVARAIVVAREEGATFATPEDLLAVRGIGPATLELIRPFADVSGVPSSSRSRPGRSRRPTREGSSTEPRRVDLNRADLKELETLPGIGPAIAERILVARRDQMFSSVDDLVRVRGVGPATVERLRARATVRPGR